MALVSSFGSDLGIQVFRYCARCGIVYVSRNRNGTNASIG